MTVVLKLTFELLRELARYEINKLEECIYKPVK